MADKTEKQHDLGVLEEDDEFEEFPAEDWKARGTNQQKFDHLNFIYYRNFPIKTSGHINSDMKKAQIYLN